MNVFQQIKAIYQKVQESGKALNAISEALPRVQDALGRIEARQLQTMNSTKIAENEFQVYSQWGEDGIIQFLLRHVPITKQLFVEFGVENYQESNTRFLLQHNNWQGLVMDGSAQHIAFIKKSNLHWRHSLSAVEAFITRDNINQLIKDNGIEGEIGILSIDIDGNDYWVWQSITVVQPAIVVVEYNHRFGAEKAVTIPYDMEFRRQNAHYSTIYYGASLKALCLLAQQKGYDFVGCNSAGNNAFFIRKSLRPAVIPALTPEEGFVSGRFRESRDLQGRLSFLSPAEEKALLATLPLINVESELFHACQQRTGTV